MGQVMGQLGAAYNRDPSLLARGYDENDGQGLHEEVRSLLTKLDAGPALTTMVNPVTGHQYEHRFFAVSALGASPEGFSCPTGRHRRSGSPTRCDGCWPLTM